LFLLALFVASWPVQLATAGDKAAAPDHITASSAVLMEATTGRIIYERNASDKSYPASTTKIMTCILALENSKLDETVSVSRQAAGVEETRLKTGDRLLMSELLQEMMLVSDNGAAVAIAEHIDGSTAAFAERMNRRARELDMKDTRFNNPNGLPDERHFSSARDMAKLAAYAMKNRDFRSIVGVKTAEIHWLAPLKTETLSNTNELLGVYPGMTGIKTGYTNLAGGCLAAAAERDGTQLIAVTLHSSGMKERFSDMRKLLDFGFCRVHAVQGPRQDDMARKLWVKGGKAWQISARPATGIEYPVVKGEKREEFSLRYDLPRFVPAPVQPGQQVGEAVLMHKGKAISHIPLYADDGVQPGFNPIGRFLEIITNIF
jgi:D-alanyl-D-alanine carboxypeptidase (penicillin-binding protein 5/6)